MEKEHINKDDLFTSQTLRCTYAQNVNCLTHVNLQMELVIVTKGELIMVIENEKYHIREGESIFVEPFETHSFESVSNECYIMVFDENTGKGFYDFLQDKAPLTRLCSVPTPVLRLVEFVCPQSTVYYDRFKAESVLAPLLSVIIEKCKFKQEKSIHKTLISAALAVINKKLLFDITLGTVAEEIGCHPVTLSKTFKASTGINFSTYIVLRRCYHAKLMLEKTEQSITEIAFNSGFGSLRDFNRCFKKVFSLTPLAYRKSNTVF